MRIQRISVLLVMIAVLACNKDKFNTKPSLKLKSVSSYVVPNAGTLTFRFEFTDKEGDISNLLNVRKIRTNARVTATLRDSLSLAVPQFPKKENGEIQVVMDYQNYLISAINPPVTGNPAKPENDTLIFKFALKDEANNVSDTVTTDKIVIIR